MITNIITMNGYAFFVWASFGFTVFACSFLYYKTYKTLKKYEEDFANELKKLSVVKQEKVLKGSKIANQVLASYSKSV
jgi:heme exporter protein D|tara:strand:- start:5041 stop:5274 length:234 start_codon:yes stop_codon:yes gene_type:complete